VTSVLRTEGLTKRFGRFTAVEDVSLQVEEGDLYGFLGLNGAGKTTTMRMILGLVRPTSGRVTVFGKDLREDFIGIMSRVGCLVELPAYYPYLSAWKNLEVLRLATGGIPEARIGELLERVGLGGRMHDPVRTYSQGMRQRLGIAMALLPKPSLVFLDEPTNGLDPHGITQIREILKDLNRKDGLTLVVSSHLLHEIELTCNRVAILKQGKLVLQDTLDRVLDRTVNGVLVRADSDAKAEALLKAQAWVRGVTVEAGGRLRVACDQARFAEVNALLVGGGVAVRELTPVRQSLEEFFLSQ
jgi:ABC-2 type transport system ATP-binding protein